MPGAIMPGGIMPAERNTRRGGRAAARRLGRVAWAGVSMQRAGLHTSKSRGSSAHPGGPSWGGRQAGTSSWAPPQAFLGTPAQHGCREGQPAGWLSGPRRGCKRRCTKQRRSPAFGPCKRAAASGLLQAVTTAATNPRRGRQPSCAGPTGRPTPRLACIGIAMPCCPGPMGRTMNMGCPPGPIICRHARRARHSAGSAGGDAAAGAATVSQEPATQARAAAATAMQCRGVVRVVHEFGVSSGGTPCRPRNRSVVNSSPHPTPRHASARHATCRVHLALAQFNPTARQDSPQLPPSCARTHHWHHARRHGHARPNHHAGAHGHAREHLQGSKQGCGHGRRRGEARQRASRGSRGAACSQQCSLHTAAAASARMPACLAAGPTCMLGPGPLPGGGGGGPSPGRMPGPSKWRPSRRRS